MDNKELLMNLHKYLQEVTEIEQRINQLRQSTLNFSFNLCQVSLPEYNSFSYESRNLQSAESSLRDFKHGIQGIFAKLEGN